MISTILTTVIGAVCIAAIFSAFKSRWLYVIAPKLYLNTPISDGQIISFDIYNAGLLAEEDVAITFRPSCNFELIATSKSTLIISGKTLSIPKLSKLESITILLLIEGKAFEHADIESVESKNSKGKIVETKEKATSLWQNILIIPVLIIFLGLPFAFGTFVGAEMKRSIIDYSIEKLEFFQNSVQLAGYKTTLHQKYNFINDENYIEKSKIKISILEVLRTGESVTIRLKIENKSNEFFSVEGDSKSTGERDGILDLVNSRIKRFGLGPNNEKEVKFKTTLPEDTSVKIIENSISFTNISGKLLQITQVIDFNNL